jgi:ABC-type glycerol-3-phosphate transport system permease component
MERSGFPETQGCSPLRRFREIAALIPETTDFFGLPGSVQNLLMLTLNNSNEFFLAFVLTSQRAVTMPVASASFAVVGMEVPWGQVCASITLLSVPPLILSYFVVKFRPYFFKVH